VPRRARVSSRRRRTAGDRCGARVAAAAQGFHAGALTDDVVVVRVVRSERHDNGQRRQRRGEPVERVREHRAPREQRILLRRGAAEATAASRRGDERNDTSAFSQRRTPVLRRYARSCEQ
jgi:hypothetical protein